MAQLFIDGAAAAGMDPASIDVLPSELASLEELVRRAGLGDVATVMSHADRQLVFDWLRGHRYAPADHARVREILGPSTRRSG